MNKQQKEYYIIAFHVIVNDTHPKHYFYADNINDAEKIAEKMIAELYNTDDADVEFWPVCKEEAAAYRAI